MLADCHMHTPLCGHAFGKPEEFVEAAADRGLSLITITCHTPMGDEKLFRGRGIRMRRDQLPEYRAFVEQARRHGEHFGVEVLYGIEAEIYPDEEKLREMDDILASEPFDFVLGSLHQQLNGYRQRWQDAGATTDADRIRIYFEDLAQGAQTGRYHSLAHPDIVRSYGGIEGAFDPVEHEEVIRAFLAVVQASGVCLEINTSGLHKEQFEIHPHPTLLTWVAEAGIPITLGSDAHNPGRVGDFFEEVTERLRGLGFEEVQVFRGGERQAVGLASDP